MFKLKETLMYLIEVGYAEAVEKYPELEKLTEILSRSDEDFWYYVTDGKYLHPEDFLDFEEDVKKVKDAIHILERFQDSLNEILNPKGIKWI